MPFEIRAGKFVAIGNDLIQLKVVESDRGAKSKDQVFAIGQCSRNLIMCGFQILQAIFLRVVGAGQEK